MTKKTIYKIFPEEKIIVEYLGGKVCWSDHIELKKKEIAESTYNPDYSVITDIRNAQLDLNALEDINKYIAFLNNNSKSVGKRKTAALTTSKEQVIHSEMLRVMKKDLPIDIKSFSTLKAAFDWLKINHQVSTKMAAYLEKLNDEFLLNSENRNVNN